MPYQYTFNGTDNRAFYHDFHGFIIVKAGIVKDEDSKVLSKIVLYLIIPCVIINAFQVDYTSKTVRGLLIAFAASVILQLVLLFIISAMRRAFPYE
ncbi:MAG: AEC family transporter [Agathobacter rectalis]